MLGAILINNAVYEHVVDIVRVDDFASAVHGRLFEAIGHLIGDGKRADPVVLKAMFDQDPALTELGGAAYLVKLVAGVVTIVNAKSYAETVGDLARRRELVAAMPEMIRDAATPTPDRPVTEVIDAGEQALNRIAESAIRGGLESIGRIASATVEQIQEAYRAGGVVTLGSGLVDLDDILKGFVAGNLIICGARPAMGKTAFAGTIAFNLAKTGKKTALFSLEMSKAELTRRWIAGLSGISTDDQRLGHVRSDDFGKLVEAEQYLCDLPIYVDNQPRLSVAQIRQRARRMKRRHGLDLVIVDHMQLIRQGGRQENRRLEIGDASSMLKAVAKELGVPVLVLSQLSRACEQRDDKRPMLADLRESGDLEQDADIVLFLYRDECYLVKADPKRRAGESQQVFNSRFAEWESRCADAKGVGEVIIAKNRHGRTGVAEVAFDGPRQRFENVAK